MRNCTQCDDSCSYEYHRIKEVFHIYLFNVYVFWYVNTSHLNWHSSLFIMRVAYIPPQLILQNLKPSWPQAYQIFRIALIGGGHARNEVVDCELDISSKKFFVIHFSLN